MNASWVGRSLPETFLTTWESDFLALSDFG